MSGMRHWLAFGSAVGFEIGQRNLHITAVRVRPSGARVLGTLEIANYAETPAAEWGAQYSAFAKKAGMQHVAATVLLPRRDVIVRQVVLPGVSDKDLDAAVGYQLETLHPFREDDVIATWARLRSATGGQSADVLVGITRRTVIDHLQTLFAEAGIKVAAFSFSAATLYSSLRLFTNPPAAGFLASIRRDDSASGEAVEAYGESPARAILSADFEQATDRARDQALSELRLEQGTEVLSISRFLPPPVSAPVEFDLSRTALPYAAALAGACPRLALPLNLLPASQRAQNSRARYVPTIVLASLLALGAIGLWIETIYQRRDYDKKMQAEIARLEPQARRLAKIDKEIEIARARTQMLDRIRRRTKADMDVLGELTKILAPPVWVSTLDLSRTSIVIGGEAGQAATLLKLLDDSPLFQNAEFLVPPVRGGAGEMYRIRAQREGIEQ